MPADYEQSRPDPDQSAGRVSGGRLSISDTLLEVPKVMVSLSSI